MFVGIAFADVEVQTAVQEETITNADLGVTDPGTLPTSRLYFFKEWGRGLQRIFTFNSEKKAELELRIADEKAAEAKQILETKNDEKSITRALTNYQKSHERLGARLEALKETSQNPNIDRLLDRLAEKSVVHEKLFEQLQEKHQDRAASLEAVKEKIADTIEKAAEKDTSQKFQQRMKNAFEKSKGSALKELRAIEMIDRIAPNLPAEKKERLEELRIELQDRLEEKIEEKAAKGDKSVEGLSEMVKRIPGDPAKRAVILEEIKKNVSTGAGEAIERAKKQVEEKLGDEAERKSKAAEQIEHAEEKLAEAKKKMSELKEVPQSMKVLQAGVEQHLQKAKEAFAQMKYGEAFGQATAAEANARNILRKLSSSPTPEKVEKNENE